MNEGMPKKAVDKSEEEIMTRRNFLRGALATGALAGAGFTADGVLSDAEASELDDSFAQSLSILEATEEQKQVITNAFNNSKRIPALARMYVRSLSCGEGQRAVLESVSSDGDIQIQCY